MRDTQKTTEVIAAMDRAKLACVRAAWKCILDSVADDVPFRQLVVDTIHLLEDREDGRV